MATHVSHTDGTDPRSHLDTAVQARGTVSDTEARTPLTGPAPPPAACPLHGRDHHPALSTAVCEEPRPADRETEARTPEKPTSAELSRHQALILAG